MALAESGEQLKALLLLPPQQQQSVPPKSKSEEAAAADESRVRIYCDILSRVPVAEIENALSRVVGMKPSPSDVESVLKLSYSHPASAVKFFRWSGLSMKHTHFAWNLMVDILGKNSLFEAMWDSIRSMKHESALSTATFASAFSSYCSANKIKEAIMTFEVMDRYGIAQDVIALNSLLSAICRIEGRTSSDAADFFDRIKTRIPPDADTFAILLEGYEKEGNFQRAKTTFGEMVIRVGWNADNMSAYDAFLTTLVRASQHDDALNFLKVMKSKNCLPGIKFFANALDILIKTNDHAHALALWNLMVGGGDDDGGSSSSSTSTGLLPNLVMYNAVIALVCNNKDIDSAFRFLDAMPFHGVFPDSLTYNTVFECLVLNRKHREARKFFSEMRKNEKLLSLTNCAAAIKMFFDEYDPQAAIEVWKHVMEEHVRPDDECANELLVGLSNLGRVGDVRKYADDMLDMGVHLSTATMEKLKAAFYKARKEDSYDHIARRVKRHMER